VRKLLVLLAILGLLVGADIAARLAADSQLQRRLALEVPDAGSADVSLHSFPFLGRLLFSGHVSGVTAEVTDIQTDDLRVASISVDLDDVRLDRDALLSERVVDLESVGRGTATAEITQGDLSEALGIPVVLSPGSVGVRIAGRTVSVSAAVRDGTLVLSGVSVPLPRLAIPGLPLLPCTPSAEALDGRLELSCRVDEVPPELLREARRRAPSS
jgi:hypothetical protein